MAKFGETKQDYDPFSSISGSLKVLSEPPTEAPAEQQVQQRAVEPSAPPVKQPARQAAPEEPKAEPLAEQGRPVPLPATVRTTEQPDQSVALRITKRIKISKQEAARLDMAALRLSATVGIGVDLSKITRALWEIYLTHEEEILRSLPADAVPAKRPANHDAIGLAELDERLANMIGEGLMMASMRNRRNR